MLLHGWPGGTLEGINSRYERPLAGEPPGGHLTAWFDRCWPLVVRCRRDDLAEPLVAPDPIQVARSGPAIPVV